MPEIEITIAGTSNLIILFQVTTCLAEYVKPFTQETVELMAQSYSAEPHETALELAKTYYTLLGKTPPLISLSVSRSTYILVSNQARTQSARGCWSTSSAA